MKRQSGFTLLEMIYCITIIAILAAILYPAFRSAKHSAQIQASLSNLHHMHVALMLYQGNQGNPGHYGSLASMGLPSDAIQATAAVIPSGLEKSPCGNIPEWSHSDVAPQVQYEYFIVTSAGAKPEQDLVKYQENTVMFTDMNCADRGVNLMSSYFKHRGLGVQLSGALLNLNRSGPYHLQSWWTKPPVN